MSAKAKTDEPKFVLLSFGKENNFVSWINFPIDACAIDELFRLCRGGSEPKYIEKQLKHMLQHFMVEVLKCVDWKQCDIWTNLINWGRSRGCQSANSIDDQILADVPDREEPELVIVFLTKLIATICAAMMSQLTNDASRGTPSWQNMSCTCGSEEASQNWVCKIEAGGISISGASGWRKR